MGVVVDPYSPTEAGLVTVVQDIGEACDFLTWKRRRRSRVA